ncbi:Long-flagella protein kinase, CMGC RCK, partial [Giardia duodenalis]
VQPLNISRLRCKISKKIMAEAATSAHESKGSSSHKYKFVSKKGAGAFSDVIKAQCVKTEEYVAIKRMKATFKSIEQITSLREIQSLRRLADQPFIIRLIEILFDRNTGRLALVFELMEMNLYELIKNRKYHLPESSIKWYMWQLLNAVRIAHASGTFHRDIKPENILLDDKDNLKLSDFGSCRGIHTQLPYTEYISTRWYRSPECLLTDGVYGPEMDLFGVGCVMFEITALFPLFPGKDELDQINRIHAILGTPPKEVIQRIRKGAKNNPIKGDFPQQKGSGLAKLIPHANSTAIDLMLKLMEYDPQKRITAEEALRHPFFKDIGEIIKLKAPTMPAGCLEKLGLAPDGRNPDVEDGPSTLRAAKERSGDTVEGTPSSADLAVTEETRSRQIAKRPQKTPPGAKRLGPAGAPQGGQGQGGNTGLLVSMGALNQPTHQAKLSDSKSTDTILPHKHFQSSEQEGSVPKLPALTRTPPARTNHGLTNVVLQGSNSAQTKLGPQTKQQMIFTKQTHGGKGKTSTSVSPGLEQGNLPVLGAKNYTVTTQRPYQNKAGTGSPYRDHVKRK